jgi:ATP-binding cassette, subfamily A (ABC1), member 3
MGVCP